MKTKDNTVQIPIRQCTEDEINLLISNGIADADQCKFVSSAAYSDIDHQYRRRLTKTFMNPNGEFFTIGLWQFRLGNVWYEEQPLTNEDINFLVNFNKRYNISNKVIKYLRYLTTIEADTGAIYVYYCNVQTGVYLSFAKEEVPVNILRLPKEGELYEN